MGEVVDANPPLELVELSREIENGGFDLILAGSDRDEHSIAESREKINSLSNADSESFQ